MAKIVDLCDLVAVGSVETGQRLDFGADGLTVVFGETGSGKSSYARVLRKACRSSAKPVEILPNVLRSAPVPNVPRAGTARIDILKGGTAEVIERDVNAPPEPDLAQVSVFDTDCANVYAEEESEIAYTPSSLRLLERLVSLQIQIKKRIDDEAATLDAQGVPSTGFDQNTKAGALIFRLSENVSPTTVVALTTLSDDEATRVDELRERIATATANDPLKASEILQRRAAAGDRLCAMIGALIDGLDQRVVADLLALNQRHEILRVQSEALSTALSEYNTRSVGGPAWKSLWQSAQSYVAGLGETFPPATDIQTVCPLCQQELTNESLARMRRFEEFFRGEVQNESTAVSRKRDAMLATLASLPALEEKLLAEGPLVLADESLLDAALITFVKSAAMRRMAIQEAGSATAIPSPALAADPRPAIERWVETLKQKTVEQKKLAAPDAIGKAKQELAELDNRVLLGDRQAAVLARIDTLKRVARLRAASAALTTTGLSRRIGEFTETAVTAQLRERLLRELTALHCDHLTVTMGARAPKGKTRVSLQLDSTRSVNVRDVLSDGERRAVALAFFLAEVAVLEHGGGVVLDDPVSSLDHARRSYVAGRLVEEAGRRQTIVFTHDVVLLLELQELAGAAGVSCETRMVRRVGSNAGIASRDLPWIAQNVGKRILYLRNDLQRLTALERKADPDEYRRHIKMWFELLREAWERAVEEKLFRGVVGRFQPGIKTLSLGSVNVTAAMTGAVEQGMTLASKWAHDEAPAINRSIPKATELASALNALDVFVAQFK